MWNLFFAGAVGLSGRNLSIGLIDGCNEPYTRPKFGSVRNRMPLQGIFALLKKRISLADALLHPSSTDPSWSSSTSTARHPKKKKKPGADRRQKTPPLSFLFCLRIHLEALFFGGSTHPTRSRKLLLWLAPRLMQPIFVSIDALLIAILPF